MQILNLTGTAAGTQPVYLPYDKAPVPFGDPISGVTMTAATPSVITVPGYSPSQNDVVTLSVSSGALLGTLTSLTISANQTYYATSLSATVPNAFSLSTQANGTPLNAFTTGLQAGTSSLITMHLLSNQVDGTVMPFKTGNQTLAINLGYYTSSGAPASITLFGAADKSSTLSTGTYGNPIGPNTYSVIATIAPYTAKLVTLSNDWVVASASTASLVLIQN